MKALRPILLTLFLISTSIGFSADERKAMMPEKHSAVFEKYCFECHDSLTEEGGVNLENLAFGLDSIEAAELWQKVLNSMNSGEMPPEDEPQVSDAEKETFLEDLSKQIVLAREALSDTGGVMTMRRLNRREYENTVFDLLGVRVDAADLPDDANSGGFDTAGNSLFFSSDQFEQYLSLARAALDEAIIFGKQPPKKLVLRRESEEKRNKAFERTSSNIKRDYDKAQEWRVTEGAREPKEFGFIDESDVKFHERLYNQQYRTLRRYLDHELADSGVLLEKHFNGAVTDPIDLPKKWPSGEYIVRAKVGALKNTEAHQRFIEFGQTGNGGRGGEMDVLDCRKITGSVDQPQLIEFRVPITKTGGRSFALRSRQHNNRDATRSQFLQHQVKNKVGPPPALWVDWIEVEGPFYEEWPPRGVSELFFKGAEWWTLPDQDLYAHEMIERFATRAFRIKKPSETFLKKLFVLYKSEIDAGKKFHEAIKEPLAVIMASPGFLYLLEPVPGQEKRELTPMETAVRLSYFLWSSPPDEKLYEVARSGDLAKPGKLAWHANRMLDDPRADEFIASFAHQWLHMDRLDFFQFDFRKYPQFDESVKASARLEVYETIRSIITEKRPLADLLNSDHVMVDDLLANYYGLDGVNHEGFKKVKLPADSPRGGLLGMAAIHAMGSDGTRSSPVERGAWVLRYILNDPPPPAPPNVPQLSRLEGKLLGPREIISAHMEEAQCAQCHKTIDPLGFGLENFDAAGLWRESMTLTQVVKKKVKKKKEIQIDARGTLPDGAVFANYFEMRDQIAKQDGAFERGFAEALIEYGLGRPYGFSDESLRERILKRADAKNGEMREFIIALIQSKPFRTKK